MSSLANTNPDIEEEDKTLIHHGHIHKTEDHHDDEHTADHSHAGHHDHSHSHDHSVGLKKKSKQ